MSKAIRRWQPPEGTLLQATQVGWFVSQSDHLAAVAKLETEHNKELARWQHDIYNYLCCVIGEPLYRIDGGACDSGDPLDFTLMEIKQCVEILKENADAENKYLREQLDALQWRPITEQDLPKVGDEVGKYHNGLFLISRISQGWKIEWQIQDGDWTHFRPLNAPPAKP